MCISLRLMHKKSYWGGRAEKKRDTTGGINGSARLFQPMSEWRLNNAYEKVHEICHQQAASRHTFSQQLLTDYASLHTFSQQVTTEYASLHIFSQQKTMDFQSAHFQSSVDDGLCQSAHLQSQLKTDYQSDVRRSRHKRFLGKSPRGSISHTVSQFDDRLPVSGAVRNDDCLNFQIFHSISF